MVYEDTQECMTMCNYKLIYWYVPNAITYFVSKYYFHDRIIEPHNITHSIENIYSALTSLRQKLGMSIKLVISMLTQNQLKDFNTDIKIYTNALFYFQSFLLISDLKLHIKHKFSKSCLIFVLSFTVTCTVSWCWVTNKTRTLSCPLLEFIWNSTNIVLPHDHTLPVIAFTIYIIISLTASYISEQ
jgi:hypothetical protein